MSSKDEKSNAPIGAYYAAPKSKFAELLDISEWSLLDKTILLVLVPIFLAHIPLFITRIFLIKNNWIIDGLFWDCVGFRGHFF